MLLIAKKRGWDLKMETLVTRKYRVRGCTRQLLLSPGYPVPASKLSIKAGSVFTAVSSFFIVQKSTIRIERIQVIELKTIEI
jgi:hypothetical protein